MNNDVFGKFKMQRKSQRNLWASLKSVAPLALDYLRNLRISGMGDRKGKMEVHHKKNLPFLFLEKLLRQETFFCS